MSRKPSVTRPQEAVRALAAGLPPRCPCAERLRHLTRGLVGREDDRHVAAEHALQDRPDGGVVGAAQDHPCRRRPRSAAPRPRAPRRPSPPRTDHRPRSGGQPRAGEGGHVNACVECVHERLVAPAGDGRVRREQSHPADPRRERRRMRLGAARRRLGRTGRLDPAARRRSRSCRPRPRAPHPPSRADADLEREARDLVERPGAVRQPRVVAKVDDVLVRHRDEQLVDDGEAVDAGVEDADEPGTTAAESVRPAIRGILWPRPGRRLLSPPATSARAPRRGGARPRAAASGSAAASQHDVTIVGATGPARRVAVRAGRVAAPGAGPRWCSCTVSAARGRGDGVACAMGVIGDEYGCSRTTLAVTASPAA